MPDPVKPKKTQETPAPLPREEIGFQADPADSGLRLDAYLSLRMRWRSRTSIQGLIQDGLVRVIRHNESRVVGKASSTVRSDDQIFVTLPRPKRDIDFGAEGPPPDPELKVIHEDRWLLAINKPPNVPVHPAGRNLYRTVITTLQRSFHNPESPEEAIVPKLCHRLDLETSGVLLVAKDDRAHRTVSEMFRERIPKKEYLAIVHGHPEPDTGLIDLPIGPALGRKVAIAEGIRHDVGQEARTRYEVVSHHGDFSLLRLDLLTGRHHQIRVHLSAIGHPLVGDKIYGGNEEVFIRYYDGALTPEDEERLILPRQALHAHRLVLDHPVTKETLELVAPLPDDLTGLLT